MTPEPRPESQPNQPLGQQPSQHSASDKPPSGIAIRSPLRHFAFVNYAVPPERVLKYLPPGLEPDTRLDDNGQPHAFISILLFQFYQLGFPALPWPRLTFFQNNYRTYIRYRGVPGVFLFRIMQAFKLASFYRMSMGMPCYFSPIHLDYSWDDKQQYYRHYRL